MSLKLDLHLFFYTSFRRALGRLELLDGAPSPPNYIILRACEDHPGVANIFSEFSGFKISITSYSQLHYDCDLTVSAITSYFH